mmetsp:Transcript_15125/g.34424  ORF Transcript_15125/g.34424 Transcript_15125/m.34424 type:complete len:231 (+) Transcript_15125:95-787(+)
MAVSVEKVKQASVLTMQLHVAAPNCVSQAYMSKRSATADNTFINLHLPCEPRVRRSTSSPCFHSVLRKASAAAEPTITMSAAAEKGTHVEGDASHDACCDSQDHAILSRFTTVILRNLPVHVDQAGVRRCLEEAGYGGSYDYLYVPARFKDGSCHGYGFINFSSQKVATTFMRKWDRSRIFCGPWHRKPLSVDIAAVQGMDALMERNPMRQVRNPRFRPYIAQIDGFGDV